jgi:hypothetical protein
MKALDILRLGAISLGLLLAEQALQLARPEWRSGSDVYLVWLLILSAARGPLVAAGFALGGGLVMDASSGHFAVFHLLYYLVPVALGTLLRSQLIVEYGLLGALAAAGLLLGKVLVMLAAGMVGGLLSGPSYLLHVNYWPLLAASLAVFAGWRWLVGLAYPLKAAGVGR